MPDKTSSPKINAELQRAIDALLIGERPIAYYSFLARALKSVTAGVLLSQFLYWTPRGRDADGWFYKEQKDIYTETALTRREQETARSVLKKFEVVEEKRIGVPGRIHFRVDTRKLAELIGNYISEASKEEAESEAEIIEYSHNGGKRQSTMAESAIVQSPNPPLHNGANQHSNTETTSETTSENKYSNIRKASPPKNRGDGEPGRIHDAVASTVSHPIKPRRSEEPATAAPENRTPLQRGGLEALGTTLHRRRGRPSVAEREARQVLQHYIEDYAREFNDQAPLKSSTSRAINLMQEAGVSLEQFIGVLYEARSITKDRTGSIRSMTSNGKTMQETKNKMSYYFAVVEDLLGLKNDADDNGKPSLTN